MSNLPSQRFISFLSSYGPFGGGKSQFDEHVRDKAIKYGISPFIFKLDKQQDFINDIKSQISKDQSKIFLISGQAGDGKTHFLRDICIHEDIFGLTSDAWEVVLRGEHQELTINEDGEILGDITAHKGRDKPHFGIQCMRMPSKGMSVYLVTDLSTLEKPEDKKTFFNVVESIASLSLHKEASDSSTQEKTFLLIAGNNGRILSIFHDYNNDSSYRNTSDEKVSSSIGELSEAFESYLLSNKKLFCDYLRLYPQSDCLKRNTVESIFETVLANEHWDRCSSCTHVNECPILANRNALYNENVIRHFADIFELAKDDGMHFTLRNLMLVISNAILGARATSKLNLEHLSCENVQTILNYNSDSIHDDVRSSPFDNLLGLNLPDKEFNDYFDNEEGVVSSTHFSPSAPIFKHLDSFGIGQQPNKSLDSLISVGCMDFNTERLGTIQSTKDSFAKLISGQNLEGKSVCFDVADLNKKLYDCLSDIQDESKTSDFKADGIGTLRIRQYLSSIRRMLFFTASEGQDHNSLHTTAFSTYSLSTLRYAANYLELKKAVNDPESPFELNKRDSLSSTIRQLICGLDRAFTSLPVLKTNNKVYVSSNNRINPAAFCIIPKADKFIIAYEDDNSSFDNAFRIISDQLLGDVSNTPTLAYYGPPVDTTHSESDTTQASNEDLLKVFGETFVTNLRNTCLDNKSFDRWLYRKKSIELEDANAIDLVSPYYEYLKTKSIQDLGAEEHEAYTTLDAFFGSKVDMPGNQIKYPSKVKPGPVVARLQLTPRMFDYLMSLGAGMSGISFTNECYSKITSFKTCIDAFHTDQLKTDNQQPIKDLGLAHTLFCSLDQYGQLPLRN